jgi:putative DNA primase/helicase
VFGVDAGGIVLQTERAAAGSAYVERGTLPEWRDNVARYAVGNDLLVLAISTAFAAPLLDVLSEPSGGVHLHGISQSGKTTTVRCAKSVYGPADDKHMAHLARDRERA